MFTSSISNVFHPTVIDQTDRDPHRQRDDDAHHGAKHHHAPAHPEPHEEAHPAEEFDDQKTTGLLIDVRA